MHDLIQRRHQPLQVECLDANNAVVDQAARTVHFSTADAEQEQNKDNQSSTGQVGERQQQPAVCVLAASQAVHCNLADIGCCKCSVRGASQHYKCAPAIKHAAVQLTGEADYVANLLTGADCVQVAELMPRSEVGRVPQQQLAGHPPTSAASASSEWR
jgi:hypothetical protein